MKTLLLISFAALFFNATTPEEQSKKFCDCLKTAEAKKTEPEKNAAKKKCLELDEKLRTEIGEDKEAKQKYIKSCETCMNELADARYGIVFNAEKTYQEKLDDVCNCFKTANTDMSYKMQCSKLQSRYAKTFEVDSIKRSFNIHINTNCQ